MTAAAATPMRKKRFLVVGATGHVGSQTTGRLAETSDHLTVMGSARASDKLLQKGFPA